MLSPEQIAWRKKHLTASDVRCLMEGDKDKIHALWREKICDPTYEREDLSNIWAVYLGTHTEDLHLNWIERKLR
jgi:hypothetical protein